MGSRSPADGSRFEYFEKLMIGLFFNFELTFWRGVLHGVIRKGSINKSML